MPRRILIIRPGAIGDTLLTFPIIQALRTQYNTSHITLVGNAAVLPLALASGLVGETSDYGQLQWSELFSTPPPDRAPLAGALSGGQDGRSLHDQLRHIDFAICWLRDPEGLVERNLLAAGVKRVVVAPGRPPEGKRIHVVDYLAETLGLPTVGAQFIAPLLVYGRQERNSLRPYNYIAIHPGSGGARKCWPVSSFAAIIEHLWQRDYAVLLLGGPADTERIATLQKALSSPLRSDKLKVLLNVPLLEVAEHLQQCRCYLGNDSGITHLAAMLGVPTIVLFGPTDPAIWRPVGPSIEVMQSHELEQISAEMVEKVMERVLERLV